LDDNDVTRLLEVYT